MAVALTLAGAAAPVAVAAAGTTMGRRAGALPAGALVAGALGAAVVGPVLASQVLRWIGARVVVPLVMQYAPGRTVLGRPPARCGTCGEPAGPGARFSVSWLLRAGRCRHCGRPVAGWVLGVELATGILFGLTVWRFGWSWPTAVMLAWAAGLVAIAAVDMGHHRVPTQFVLATAGACSAVALAAAVTGAGYRPLGGAMVGGAMLGGFLAVVHALAPDGLGAGDVRLGWLVGGVTGWVVSSAGHEVRSIFSSVVASLLVSIGIGLTTHLVLARCGRPATVLPFAPALGAGAFAVLLVSA